MKFAKELERECVPEWRIKYLNYKAGKKHVKAVARAINRTAGTPLGIIRTRDLAPRETPNLDFDSPPLSRRRNHGQGRSGAEDSASLRKGSAPMGRSPERRTPAMPTPATGERQGLAAHRSEVQYGSFIPTPLARTPTVASEAQTFELPAPAIGMPASTAPTTPDGHNGKVNNISLSRLALQRSHSQAGSFPPPPRHATMPNMAPSDVQSPRQALRRMFSGGSSLAQPSQQDISMQPFDEVREREKEFFAFLDSELEKVETFYKQKEDHAGRRLVLLREQLHEMRNRRTEEIAEARRRKERGDSAGTDDSDNGKSQEPGGRSMMLPFKGKLLKPGKNSRALQKMPQTPLFAGASGAGEGRRDYVRRPHDQDVPYRTAKRKLKLALQEFYRGLELLKSYALLNRTAFRKLNKKYDKAVNARPPYRYMNEKVNKAWFVNSDVLEGYLQAVEDLYARYFERGNRKIAAGKLRSLSKGATDESGSAFLNGLLLGTGLVFAIQGTVYAAELLFDHDPVVRLHTTYLLQIYGGYFLMLYLFMLFCLDCKLWTINKINYPFIFEFDPRNHLDWRQLATFPCFFMLLLGLFMWVNFTRYGSPSMYIYYPVILVGVSLILLFFPAPVLFHKSRRWFLYAHWRLFWAGLYPVEFRDFFLGDIYSSLTYATSNVELFFCVYANYWKNPVQCNSNHSRLLGFFSTLPSIWRALQCIRRYHDTKNVFPHLVNCGKYTATILSYIMLSVYRIDRDSKNLSLFILFSTINSVYTSIWDLFMDFSLLQPHARHSHLRDITALKSRWPYYFVMVADPILRFNWIFYAIFTHNTQHSTIVSFLVSLAEATRRGMWALFRVENEHCANVAQYKASRDVPLPYQIEPLVGRTSLESAAAGEEAGGEPPARASTAASTGVDVGRTPSARAPPTPATVAEMEEGGAPGPAPAPAGTVRHRRPTLIGRRSIARIMAEAHKQDFEKRRKPGGAAESLRGAAAAPDDDLRSDDDDDDDDDDAGSIVHERMEAREVEMLGGSARGLGRRSGDDE